MCKNHSQIVRGKNREKRQRGKSKRKRVKNIYH